MVYHAKALPDSEISESFRHPVMCLEKIHTRDPTSRNQAPDAQRASTSEPRASSSRAFTEAL